MKNYEAVLLVLAMLAVLTALAFVLPGKPPELRKVISGVVSEVVIPKPVQELPTVSEKKDDLTIMPTIVVPLGTGISIGGGMSITLD